MEVNFFGTDKTFEIDNDTETYLKETLKDKLDNEKTLTDKWYYGIPKSPLTEEEKNDMLREDTLIKNKD